MRLLNPIAAALAVLAGIALFCVPVRAAGKIDCEMHFSLTGWAAIYKHAEGGGTITCSDGKSYRVNIVAVGGGLTAGKYKLEDVVGKFPKSMRHPNSSAATRKARRTRAWSSPASPRS